MQKEHLTKRKEKLTNMEDQERYEGSGTLQHNLSTGNLRELVPQASLRTKETRRGYGTNILGVSLHFIDGHPVTE